jgi:hypothetical protein
MYAVAAHLLLIYPALPPIMFIQAAATAEYNKKGAFYARLYFQNIPG